jgi:hypothetical protein
MKLYIDKTQFSEGGEEYEGEEGPYATRHPTYITTTFTNATFSPSKMFYETIDVSDSLAAKLQELKQVYLGVVFYSDGDTFGTTYGYFKFTGVSETQEGVERINKKALENGVDDMGYVYKPWEGYFNGLIGFEIFLLKIV